MSDGIFTWNNLKYTVQGRGQKILVTDDDDDLPIVSFEKFGVDVCDVNEFGVDVDDDDNGDPNGPNPQTEIALLIVEFNGDDEVGYAPGVPPELEFFFHPINDGILLYFCINSFF
ncbi:hypothetical protein ACTFIT_000281 [Dictyostelium discoideum]